MKSDKDFIVRNWFRVTAEKAKSWMNEANGWQRLWLIATVVWLAFIIYKKFSGWPNLTAWNYTLELGFDRSRYCSPQSIDWGQTRENMFGFVTLLILPPIATYAFGVASSWVVKGFNRAK